MHYQQAFSAHKWLCTARMSADIQITNTLIARAVNKYCEITRKVSYQVTFPTKFSRILFYSRYNSCLSLMILSMMVFRYNISLRFFLTNRRNIAFASQISTLSKSYTNPCLRYTLYIINDAINFVFFSHTFSFTLNIENGASERNRRGRRRRRRKRDKIVGEKWAVIKKKKKKKRAPIKLKADKIIEQYYRSFTCALFARIVINRSQQTGIR